MFSADVGQEGDADNGGDENPVEDDDEMEGAKDMASMVGIKNTFQDYRDPPQSMDADEDEEDGAAYTSDHDMDATPEKKGMESETSDDFDAHPKKIHAPKPKQHNSNSAKASQRSKRPRKRQRRASSSPEIQDDEDNTPEADSFNLCASLWEPTPFNDVVSTKYVFLECGLILSQVVIPDRMFESRKQVQPPRFKFQTDIRAFDASGGEHRFTPECHVSGSGLLEYM
jgi:hypothetical protein